MIIFLYGKDSYRLKESRNKITEEYKKKYSGLAFSIFDLNEPDGLIKLEDTIKTVSFFDEKRLIVVKNSFGNADLIVELIKKWDIAGDKQRILMFIEESDEVQLVKKDKKLFMVLNSEPNVIKKVELLSGAKLESWLVKEIRATGYEIEKNALVKLLNYILGTSQKELDPSVTWRLKQEADKLINYKSTQDSKLITIADIELLVTPKIDLNIFSIIDAVAFRNKALSLKFLHHYLEEGEDPYYIFSMLVYQFRNMVRVKHLATSAVIYSDIIKKTGLNPYVVKKTYEQCSKYTLEEINRLFSSLASLDLGVKNGDIDIENGLYSLVFAL